MKNLKLLTITAMFMVALLMGVQSTSHALTLGFNDTVNPAFYVVDQSPQDSNLTVGAVTYIGAIGVWSVNVTTGISKPVVGSAEIPEIDLHSVNVSSGLGGRLIFGVVDSGFTGPVSGGIAGPFEFAVGGTVGGIGNPGSISFRVYGDDLNVEDFSAAGAVLFASSGPFSNPPLAFSGSAFGSFPATAPFSLAIIADINHPQAGTTSFNAYLHGGGKIPEPMSLILLGSGLAGVGLYRRLRKPKD